MSLTHLLILGLIIAVVYNRNKIPELGRSIGEGLRQFKKGVNGESDIDITHTVKHLNEEEDKKGES